MSTKDPWGDDTLLSVAMNHGDAGWNWSSFVHVETPGGPIPAVAQISDEREEAVLWSLSLEHHEALDKLGTTFFTLRSRPGNSAEWHAVAEASGRIMSPLAREIVVPTLKILSDGSKTAHHRIVYRGIKIPDYTNKLWLKDSESSTRGFGFTPLKLFGRDMILSEIAKHEDIEHCYVGLSMKGEFLKQSQLDAVEMVLYLLAGVGGMRQCVETYDGNGKRRGRSFHRLGHAMERHEQSIFPKESFAGPAFYGQVSKMIERAEHLILNGFPLRAVLFHIFSSQRPIPEISITHLGIALDGAQKAIVEKRKDGGKLMPQKVFNQRIAPVVVAAKEEFAAPEDQESLTLILRKILTANDWSLSARRDRFWREHIQYQLTDQESAALEHRHTAIHEAYILRTEYDLKLDPDPKIDRRPYEQRLDQLTKEAQVFRNILNRVILVLLEYRGEFVDFTKRTDRLSTIPATSEHTSGGGPAT